MLSVVSIITTWVACADSALTKHGHMKQCKYVRQKINILTWPDQHKSLYNGQSHFNSNGPPATNSSNGLIYLTYHNFHTRKAFTLIIHICVILLAIFKKALFSTC